MDNHTLDFARNHLWQGRKLFTYTMDELIDIQQSLIEVAPPTILVPLTMNRDELLISIMQLDLQLEPLRPLGETLVKPPQTPVSRPHQNMDFWRR